MNIRPLTQPSGDCSDPEPLTPADFLGRGNRFMHLLPLTEGPELAHHARQMRTAYKKLWEIYHEEYLMSLQKYHRQQESKKKHEYQVGNLVHLISEERTIPTEARTFAGELHSVTGRYRLGRITEIVKSDRDGQDRLFLVKQPGGEIKRCSAMNIAPLYL